MDTFKKTILIDLDGVLNTYTGNFDKDFIPPIKEGAKEFLENLSKKFVIKICLVFSGRSVLHFVSKSFEKRFFHSTEPSLSGLRSSENTLAY